MRPTDDLDPRPLRFRRRVDLGDGGSRSRPAILRAGHFCPSSAVTGASGQPASCKSTGTTACVVDETGKVVFGQKVINSQAAIEALIARIGKKADGVVWAVDMTSGSAGLLITLLLATGRPVVYAPGRLVNRMAGAFAGEGKTDAKDARTIAETARLRGDLTPVASPNDIAPDLRILTARREDLMADWGRGVNRIRELLASIFPSLERAFDFSTRSALILLTGFQTPDGVRAAGTDGLRAYLTEHQAHARSIPSIVDKSLFLNWSWSSGRCGDGKGLLVDRVVSSQPSYRGVPGAIVPEFVGPVRARSTVLSAGHHAPPFAQVAALSVGYDRRSVGCGRTFAADAGLPGNTTVGPNTYSTSAEVQDRIAARNLLARLRYLCPSVRHLWAAMHPMAAQLLLQLAQQRAADAAVAPPRVEGEHRQPGALTLHLGRRHTDHVLTHDRHHRRVTRPSDRDHLGGREDRLSTLPALIPDVDRLVEVVIVKIAHPPRRHDTLRVVHR
ncbi:transposase [Saccharopolyspora erythraea D]|nr:transposase [Saccharopolyspora erythraea D]